MGFKIKNSLTGEFEKLPILTLKGEKGETGGVEEYNKVDYMGNKYETLKQANDANVEYAVKTAIGEFNYLDYDGQHITATDTIEGQSKSAILKGNTLVNNVQRITTTSGYTTIHNNGIGFTIDTNGETTTSRRSFNLSCINKITVGGKYTVIVDVAENTLTRESGGQTVLKIVLNNYNQMNSGFVVINVGETGLRVFEVIASSVATNDNPYMETPNDINGRLIVNGISIIEGHNHNLTGFIEGMQSVKMPVLTTV